MKYIRNCLLFCAAFLFLWLGIYTYNQLTDGFSIHQITSSLPPCPHFNVTLSEEEKNELCTLLDQTFRYLGKGTQFYVFQSEDGKTVIKFPKQKHLRTYAWLNAIPMPASLSSVRDTKIARRKARVENLFSSCKLAYEKMREETGLLFIHLDKVPALHKKITLIDKIGFKHTLNIDDYEYIIQRKAITVKERLTHLDEQELAHAVEQMIDLVLSRCQKGIRDRDRSFVPNIAFSVDEQKAIFIDTGQFYEDSSIMQKEMQMRDVEARLADLRYWMGRHFPQWASNIDTFIH